jgi:transcriptional regulator with XRE-family HTH domain
MNAALRRKISDQVRAAIRKSDLSQNEIAARTRIDKAALSRFMNGHRGISLEAIERLAEELGLHLVEKR